MDELSRDTKMKDDSVEIEIKNKMHSVDHCLMDFDFGEFITKQNVVEDDYFDALRVNLKEKEEENILDKSAIFPESELNLKFDNPFTDRNKFSLQKVLEICEVA